MNRLDVIREQLVTRSHWSVPVLDLDDAWWLVEQLAPLVEPPSPSDEHEEAMYYAQFGVLVEEPNQQEEN